MSAAKGERVSHVVMEMRCRADANEGAGLIAEGTRDMLGETDRGDRGFGSTGRQ